MHNKIYQIELTPINEDEYLHESQLEDYWFTNAIADRISDEIDYDECISNLKRRLEHNKIAKFSEEDNSFMLLANAQKSHFADSYTNFVKAIKTLSETTENEFLSDFEKVDKEIRNICSLFCNCFEDYVFSDEFGPVPFDEFIRNAETGKPYYIGGIVDYHW